MSEEKTNAEQVEEMIAKFSKELREAHTKKYDLDKAELTAALCLDIQKEMTEFIADSELLAKEAKAEVERIEAERYFHYKEHSGVKLTDAGLKHMVAKDEQVLKANKSQFLAESKYNKWKNLFGVLKDGHVYFRSLAKGKNDY